MNNTQLFHQVGSQKLYEWAAMVIVISIFSRCRKPQIQVGLVLCK